MLIEEIEEMTSVMKNKASSVYHVSCKERFDIANDDLVSLWRQMLVNWMIFVVDCCELQRHSVAAAAYFLDVAMLRDLCQTREEHQLAAATALQMSLKTFDIGVIKLDKLVQLGRGHFSEDDVSEMEMKIITSLNWNLHPPTIYCFFRQYERLAPTEMSDEGRETLDQVFNIIAVEMTMDELYIKFCPSIQGIATMLVSLDFIPDDCLPYRQRRAFESRLTAMIKTEKESATFSKVIKKIYRTLNQKDKIQTIIDITSTNTKGARMYQKALRKVEKKAKKTRPGSKSTHGSKSSKGSKSTRSKSTHGSKSRKGSKSTHAQSKSTHEQHSPRDVKAKIRFKLS